MTQTPILTITVNPALDLSAEAPEVRPGPKLRLSEPVVEPGGGGINVARAIHLLGGQARILAALGGLSGARIRTLLEGAGHAVVAFGIEGETRQSLSVTDRRDGEQYRFVLPGPAWDAALAGQMLEAVAQAAGGGGHVVLSGSQPPGLAVDFPAQLVRRLVAADCRVTVDTSGPALARLVGAGDPGGAPWCLRMDQAESEEQAGRPLADAGASLDFAGALVARGAARVVILARGAEGSVLATEGLRLHCRPPAVPVLSKVGAGDSFTGAFVLATARGQDLAAALVFATAAAASAVGTPATELCRREQTEALVRDCVLLRA